MMGTLHSTKMSGLHCQQLPITNGTAFPKISKKRTRLRGIPKFSKKFYWQFSFHSTFLPKFLEFSVCILEIQQFPEFLETFPGNFCTICHFFQTFKRFGWKESALYCDARNARTYSLTNTQTSKTVIWTTTFNCLYCWKVLFTPWSHGSFCDHELSQICVPWNEHKACEGENRKQSRLRNVRLQWWLL